MNVHEMLIVVLSVGAVSCASREQLASLPASGPVYTMGDAEFQDCSRGPCDKLRLRGGTRGWLDGPRAQEGTALVRFQLGERTVRVAFKDVNSAWVLDGSSPLELDGQTFNLVDSSVTLVGDGSSVRSLGDATAPSPVPSAPPGMPIVGGQ